MTRLAAGACAGVAMVALVAGAGASRSAIHAEPQRFLSPTGSDRNPCTRAAPCQTLDRAYRISSPGGVVELAGGTYTSSAGIEHDPTKVSPDDVVFQPAAGATVTLTQQLVIHGSHVTFDGSTGAGRKAFLKRGFKIESNTAATLARDITIEHVDARGEQSNVFSSDGVRVRDADIGGHCSGQVEGDDALLVTSNLDTSLPATNLVVEDSRIGQICLPLDAPDEHPDCVSVSGARNFVFRRNRVWYCGTQGFYTSLDFAGAIVDNILVENNWFGTCDTPGDASEGCYYSVHIRYGTNIVVRYNSFAVNQPGGFSSQDVSVLLLGNAGKGPSCGSPGVTYAYNVWSDAKCSATDLRADPRFVKNDGEQFNLHLQPDSPAIGRGDSTRAPTTDIDGQMRRLPPDAGADERPSMLAFVTRAGPRLTRGAARVTHLVSGRYKLVVRDRSTIGNLHLRGPGVNRRTPVKGVDSITWIIVLRPGTYSYWSDSSPTKKTALTVRPR